MQNPMVMSNMTLPPKVKVKLFFTIHVEKVKSMYLSVLATNCKLYMNNPTVVSDVTPRSGKV